MHNCTECAEPIFLLIEGMEDGSYGWHAGHGTVQSQISCFDVRYAFHLAGAMAFYLYKRERLNTHRRIWLEIEPVIFSSDVFRARYAHIPTALDLCVGSNR